MLHMPLRMLLFKLYIKVMGILNINSNISYIKKILLLKRALLFYFLNTIFIIKTLLNFIKNII